MERSVNVTSLLLWDPGINEEKLPFKGRRLFVPGNVSVFGLLLNEQMFVTAGL